MEKQKKKYDSDLTTMKKTNKIEKRKRHLIQLILQKRQQKWSHKRNNFKEMINNNNKNDQMINLPNTDSKLMSELTKTLV